LTNIDLYDTINPMDFRYYSTDESLYNKIQPYLSENAMVSHMAKVELALVKTLSKRGFCSKSVVEQVSKACKDVTAEEVYEEEKRIKHNIRALVNCIRKKVTDEAKPFVHFTTTSHDIICTADAMRFKNFTLEVLIPSLTELMKTLIGIAEREKETLQIGRTHGQHAEPITFGFALAEYISRLGKRIKKTKIYAKNLKGKISGAVGAYNAASLFIEDPVAFERDVLAELDLKRGKHSTQIVEPEYVTDLAYAVISTMGILANLADDMRHLQRSEIAEVGEVFDDNQVGSSTMPHKRNPINFENIKSMWKAYSPRMLTVFMDQISEHQRDLTNSASSRYIPEILAALLVMSERMTNVMKRLVVDTHGLRKNFDMNRQMIAAEPLYILLSANGHPDAHEHVRQLTLESQKSGKPLEILAFKDRKLKPYIKKFTKKQIDLLKNPSKYTGVASKKVEEVCRHWKKELKL